MPVGLHKTKEQILSTLYCVKINSQLLDNLENMIPWLTTYIEYL